MNTELIGINAALLSAASWALGATLFKQIGDFASPLAITLSKGMVSIILLSMALFFVDYTAIPWQDLSLLCLSGILGVAVGDTLFFAALRDLGPTALIVFFMSGQILTALLAMVFLGEIPPTQTWCGIAITTIGIGAVMWAKIASDQDRKTTRIRGVLLGTLFMLCMSASVIIAKPCLASVSTVWATLIRLTAGTLCILLLGICTGKINDWINPFLDKNRLILFLISVCVVTFGGFWLSLVAIKYVGIAIANTLGATEALFILPLSYFFLKERIEKIEVFGTIVATVGILLIYTN